MPTFPELLRWFGIRPSTSGNNNGSWLNVCCLNRGDDDEEEQQQKRLLAAAPRRRASRSDSKVTRTAMFLEHGSSQELKESYDIERKVIGRGGFGTVRRATLKDSPHIVRAVKDVRKRTPKLQKTVHREIGVLRRLDHPNICRLYETFEDTKHIYLIMELIEGRELFDELQEEIMNGKRIDENRAACIMHQVFSALSYCHEHDIIHRDLKPENIMVCNQHEGQDSATPVIKIIDFGLAVLADAEGYRTRQLEGTEAYLAPEAKMGNCLPVSDVWSTGVILHIILLGVFPKRSKSGGIVDDEGVEKVMSEDARDLIRGLLEYDTELRLTAAQAIKHTWTTGNYEQNPRRTALLSDGVGNFMAFCRTQRLQQAALTAMATQLSSQQMEQLQEQFSAMDADGNGVISQSELLEAVRKAPPEGVTDLEAWVQATFDEVDTDGSGEIEFTEWQAIALRNIAGFSDEAIHAAFRVLDSDNSGSISLQELARVLGDTPGDIKACLSEFDLNGDGEIDFEEFRDLLVKAIPRKG